MTCACGLGRTRSRRKRGLAGVPYSYKATILGESVAWARKARDCLRRGFARLGVPARVTAVGENVVVTTPKRRVSYDEGRRALERLEKRCGL